MRTETDKIEESQALTPQADALIEMGSVSGETKGAALGDYYDGALGRFKG